MMLLNHSLFTHFAFIDITLYILLKDFLKEKKAISSKI